MNFTYVLPFSRMEMLNAQEPSLLSCSLFFCLPQILLSSCNGLYDTFWCTRLLSQWHLHIPVISVTVPKQEPHSVSLSEVLYISKWWQFSSFQLSIFLGFIGFSLQLSTFSQASLQCSNSWTVNLFHAFFALPFMGHHRNTVLPCFLFCLICSSHCWQALTLYYFVSHSFLGDWVLWKACSPSKYIATHVTSCKP